MKRSFLYQSLVLVALAFGWSVPSKAIDSIYIGGKAGYMGLTGNFSNTYSNNLGYGLDLAFRTNGIIDLTLGFQTSSQIGLNLYAGTLSADVHVGQISDFDFMLGAGPGAYVFTIAGNPNETKFGLNFGGAVDLVIEDHFRVGVGGRYHAIFGADNFTGSFYTIMARFGYQFDV
jgi:hypothetical protein